MVRWIRARALKHEPSGEHCIGCRTFLAGTNEDELRGAGGVFLDRVGWFCGSRCERQYRFRFRIQ